MASFLINPQSFFRRLLRQTVELLVQLVRKSAANLYILIDCAFAKNQLNTSVDVGWLCTVVPLARRETGKTIDQFASDMLPKNNDNS
ncbi:hypothetical protein JTB14_016525 [Gonioctena quinquepunctata]|nr:hypothetical protein JTB14_016525 [Gonioctena quinquepunctata]